MFRTPKNPSSKAGFSSYDVRKPPDLMTPDAATRQRLPILDLAENEAPNPFKLHSTLPVSI